MTEAEQNPVLAHEAAKLSALHPTACLPPTEWVSLLGDARLVFVPAGGLVIDPDRAPAKDLMLIRQGAVVVRGALRGRIPDSGLESLGPGSLLPIDSALPTRAPGTYIACEDSFCWMLSESASTRLLSEPAILRWMLEQAWRLYDCLVKTISRDLEANQISSQIKFQRLRSILKGHPATLPVDASISDALALMATRRIGSVVVVDEGRPIGIVTESDVVRRMLAAGVAPDRPVSSVMTPRPHTLSESASVAAAVLEMNTRSIRHLPVVNDDGIVTAVVSERDLFRLQRTGFGHFSAPIERAEDLAQLRAASAAIREVCAGFFANGMAADQVTALLSSLSDRIAESVIRIVSREDEPPPAEYCWLALGSEGRHEQTFSTDQDNGIIFSAPAGADIDALRARLAAFAGRVNEGLDRCGFPLCKGNIMAGNPQWCLTLDEWKARFASWIRSPEPKALLNANIFFDFRALHGATQLAEELREHLFSLTRENSLFLAMMAKNALQISPPIGKLSRFSTDRGEHAGTIDLKTAGSRLFVDIARILALRDAVRATGTAKRLQIGGEKMKRKPTSIEADVDAFHFVQSIRMRAQLRHEPGSKLDANRIDPYALNEIEQRVLRESFNQAQLLQARIKLDFQL